MGLNIGACPLCKCPMWKRTCLDSSPPRHTRKIRRYLKCCTHCSWYLASFPGQPSNRAPTIPARETGPQRAMEIFGEEGLAMIGLSVSAPPSHASLRSQLFLQSSHSKKHQRCKGYPASRWCCGPAFCYRGIGPQFDSLFSNDCFFLWGYVWRKHFL